MNEQTVSSPRITVLMPVFNGARYLSEAIGSILWQTYADFELLIINDGSTDGSADIVRSFRDSRIRLLENDRNQGLVFSLNRGMREAGGEYVARMDCDDIALPERLAVQARFMDENRNVGICSSWIEAFDGGNATVWAPPLRHEEILSRLPFESVIYHPSVIIRNCSFKKHHLCYDETYRHAEDYELWSRCADLFRVAVIGRVLLRYRLHPESVGERERSMQQDSADRVRANLLSEIGIVPTQKEVTLHRALSLWRVEPAKAFVLEAHEWLIKLMDANTRCGRFPEPEFSKTLAERWRFICFQAAETGFFAYKLLNSSPLYNNFPLSSAERLKMIGRCLLRRSRRNTP